MATASTSSSLRSRELASAEVDGFKIRFIATATENGESLSVQESGSAYVGAWPLDSLLAQGATNLEIFRALLPDAEVPAEIVAAHEAQARRAGRSDTTPRTMKYEHIKTEKSAVACNTAVFTPLPSQLFYQEARWLQNASNSGSLPVISWQHRTGLDVVLGVCNDAASQLTFDIAKINTISTGGQWQVAVHANLAGGEKKRFYVWGERELGQCTLSDNICVGDCDSPTPRVSGNCMLNATPHDTGWGIGAQGSKYHLATAEVMWRIL